MILIILITLLLVLATFCLHQAAFTLLARYIPMGARATHPKFFLMMMGIFTVHLLEILLYALGFYVAGNLLGLGYIEGEQASGVLGHFYASAVFYTSLGFGDVLPYGPMRFLASIEALNGLLLIAWSASFLFAAMDRSWHCLSGEKYQSRPPAHGDEASPEEDPRKD